MRSTCSTAKVLKAYNLEAPGRALVRTFDTQFLLGGDLLSDFFAVSRCPLKVADLRLPEGNLNTGLPLEWCEVLRGLNVSGDPGAAAIRDAAPPFGSAERSRIMEHYFMDDVRDFVLSGYISWESRSDRDVSCRSIGAGKVLLATSSRQLGEAVNWMPTRWQHA